MVSSGTVNSDLSSFNNSMTAYDNSIDSLNGSWKGPSYENLNSKAKDFFNEFKNALQGQLSAFASACDLYEQYINEKNAYLSALSSANSDPNNSSYSTAASEHKANMERLKQQIEAALQSASSPSLSAQGTTALDVSFNAGSPLGINTGTYQNTFTSSAGKNMQYYAYVPNNATEGMPLILFLHGDGSVNNMNALKTGEMARAVKKTYGDDFPFIFVQPMTEVTSWSKDGRLDTLAELVQQVAKDYKCDPNKIVLAGHSRGGNGTWEMIQAHPELFSAAVPISGIDRKINPANCTKIPIVAVSTPDSSDNYNYGYNQSTVKEINNAGGNASFVSANGYGHSSAIYGAIKKGVLDWAIAQTKA